MSDFSAERDPFEVVAESFLARYRAGERPSIDDFAARHPELAEPIRKLLPALVRVERDLAVEDGAGARGMPAIPGAERRLGDYRILREIGRGGMGVVYEAEQVSLGRRVALKVLPGHVAHNRLALARFRREAKAAARLHHTNIVPVFEVGSDGETAYYAMQFIEGQGLDQVIDELARLRDSGRKPGGAEGPGPTAAGAPPSLIAQSLLNGRFATEGAVPSSDDAPAAASDPDATGRFDTDAAHTSDFVLSDPQRAGPSPTASPAVSAVLPGGSQVATAQLSGRRAPFFRSVAQIGRQAAQALAYAHASGIVHRDIKPSNLLLDHAGTVWVADFGLAKGEDEGLTQTGDIVGTIRYMPPCRFRGEGDARADIYALGMTLYELLTLRPGFDESDRLNLIEQIKTEEPPKPRSIDARIPRDLETIVVKAIEKEPKARYQSAQAMAEDLGRFLADEPIKARQVSAAERYWRWARRNPVIAVLGGVLTAVLVAVTVGSMVAATYFRSVAGVAVKAEQHATLERDKSRQLSASLTLDKGLALGQQGHADQGLLWMLEALKTAPDNAEEFRRTVRWNLGAWLGQVHKPLRIIDPGDLHNRLAFSPDGRSLATSYVPHTKSNATSIDLWDTASGRKLSTFPGAFGPFAFHPDGKVLVAHTDEQHILAIDLVTGRAPWTSSELPGDERGDLAFSLDGSTVLVNRYDSKSRNMWLLRLDVGTGQQRGEPMRGWAWIAVAPDGRTVATRRLENGEVYIDLYDLPSGRRTACWPAGRQGPNWELLFNPDGKSLYVDLSGVESVAFDRDGYGQIWDAVTGRPTSPLMAGTISPTYTPAGDRLVTENDYLRSVRDAATGRERGPRVLAGGTTAFHPDGRTVLTSTFGDRALLWQVSAEAEPLAGRGTDPKALLTGSVANRKWRGFNAFRSGRLRADGQIAVSLADGAGGQELIRLSDPATGRSSGKPASHYPGWVVRVVAFSPDGRCFATGSNPDDRHTGELRLWDASTGRLRFPPVPYSNWVAALAFQPDGKVLAAGDYDGLVRFWDTWTGREIGRPLPQGEMVLTLAYSPDGTMIAVGLASERGKSGTRLWDTRTRQPIGELLPSNDPVTRIEFRPDGRALLAGSDHSLRPWDTTRGQPIGEPMMDESAGGFHPDGRAFITLGKDGTVKLRDASTGSVLLRLLTSSSPATCAAFRGDGGLVAAGFEDGTVRLCDLATAQPVGPPRSMRHAVHEVVFTSDGRSVAAIDEFGESRTWPVPEPLPDSSLDDLTLRIEARTGLRMETGLTISRLDGPAWRERLEQLGRLDPKTVQLDDGPAWHEPMLREAEQNGNTFAAIWHLDRLIAARPDDWLLYARRARAWSLSDKFDKAASDYQEAERLGSRDQVLDFQAHCASESTTAERWAEALWYLDRLIAARPDEATLHEERAAVYGKLGREADRQAELARVFERGADQGLVMPRAEELGRAGRWAEAAGLLARCGRAGPLSPELARAWAIACLKAGDRAGYRDVCAAVGARNWPDSIVAWDATHAGAILALGVQGLDEYRVPIAWFERRLADGAVPPPIYRPYYFPNALGGLLLRAGRIDEAIVRLNEGTAAAKEAKFQDYPTDWAYLALAHARKGNFAEARRWLDRLRTLRPASSMSFWDLQQFALLRSEAEGLLFDAEFPGDPFHGPGPR
jgi:WD40 repeat protein/tRNA A-37 threonylcarbamoyl transferase component Bud32/tetratricopeptide (TPR) repeat protein